MSTDFSIRPVGAPVAAPIPHPASEAAQSADDSHAGPRPRGRHNLAVREEVGHVQLDGVGEPAAELNRRFSRECGQWAPVAGRSGETAGAQQPDREGTNAHRPVGLEPTGVPGLAVPEDAFRLPD